MWVRVCMVMWLCGRWCKTRGGRDCLYMTGCSVSFEVCTVEKSNCGEWCEWWWRWEQWLGRDGISGLVERKVVCGWRCAEAIFWCCVCVCVYVCVVLE